MPRHTILIESLEAPPPPTLTITGDEAKHALRVKRIRVGDTVALTNGQGLIATARATSATRELQLEITDSAQSPAPAPQLALCTATPKGPRLEKMIDMLSQCGATSWAPLHTRLGVVDPGANKLDRMHRVCIESAKQCARPWLMSIAEPIDFAQAIAPTPDTLVVIADASGDPMPALPDPPAHIRLLVGPEGGWHDQERATARDAGATLVNLGPHQMRIETAAVAAIAITQSSLAQRA